MGINKKWIVPALLLVFAVFVWFFYVKLLLPPYLTFSDSAKFADVARNFVSGNGFGSNFAPFEKEFLGIEGLLPISIPPLFPLFIAAAFKVFSVYDLMVPMVSGIFYLLSIVILFYLGKKIFNGLIGLLAALAFIFDPAMLNYATSGASESLFIFALILAALLFYRNTKVSQFFGFLVLLLSYFTRPSAVIYIVGFTLFFILMRFKNKMQILKAGGMAILIWLLIEAILIKLGGKFFLYSPLASFFYGAAKFSPLSASTETLRGGMTTVGFQLQPFFSKFFYNLYNFYKLLPQIFSPYLIAVYFLSLFRWEESRERKIFRGLVLFFVLATFFAAAATLPIYRYLHPIIPFVYLLAVETMVWLLAKIFTEQKKIAVAGFLLILFFIGGQTLGKIFLDLRYLQAHTNQGKPPVYVQLSWLLKENTRPDDLIITNLDTWGTWYGERKTVWYPLEPSQLIPDPEKELRIDAIYLTSYKMDDENYYMGENWRQAFENPIGIKNEFLKNNFNLKETFEIKAEETFENEPARAVLLIRK